MSPAVAPVRGSAEAVGAAAIVAKPEPVMPVAVPVPLQAAPQVAAGVLKAVNTAAARWFDSVGSWLSTLPRPLNELLSGALLLVRRTLFNQLPTAQPFRYLTSVSGDRVGTLRVRDPEGDPVTYRLLQAPLSGTVEIADDGTWIYTPGTGDAASDEFRVAVGNPGFNLLDPFSSRVTEVTVQVGNSANAPPDGELLFTREFEILNLTTTTLGLDYVGGIGDRGQTVDISEYILAAPPVCVNPTSCGSGGTLLKPADTAYFSIGGTLGGGIPDVSVLLAPPSDLPLEWWAVLKGERELLSYITVVDATQGYGYVHTFAEGDGTFPAVAALVGPPDATTTLASTDQGAPELVTWFLANITPTMTNVVFNGNPPGDPGFTRQISVDNAGDGQGSINQAVSASTSTAKGSSWDVKASWSPIAKILGLDVAGKYGTSESETTSKTFTTTVTSTSLPWSANEILTAPPKLLVTGDAQFVLGSRTYVFTGVQYYFPSQTLDVPLYLIMTEPLQPKYTAFDDVAPALIGTPIPNVGFTLLDKSSQFLSPTYTVGQRSQLTVSAYQGVGPAADKTGDPRTVYSTSDAAVATVDKSGALTAVGPGKATITARYDWSIPYGGGFARNDYVLATMDVTVQKP